MASSEHSLESALPDLIPWRRIVILIGLAVTAGSGLAYFLEGKGFQAIPGTIEARTTTIVTNRIGRVDSVVAKVGQSVVPGDTLFQLVDPQLDDRLLNKRREISEYEADALRTKAATDIELSWRRRDLQAEIFEMQLKVAALSQEKLNKQVEQIAWKEHLTSCDPNVDNAIPVSGHPFRSVSLEIHTPNERRLQAMLREDAAAAAVETLTAQLTLSEQRLKTLEQLDQEIESKVRASSGIDLAETRLNGAKKELLALESQIKDLTLTSPTYGTVGEVKLQPGDRVTLGERLTEILDDQQPHIIANIPSSAAAQVHLGSKITILFPSDQQRLGIVTSIPLQTVSVPGYPESILAVKIEPAGKLWPRLAIGSNVKVLLP